MGVTYSTIWSEDFQDKFFLRGIRRWLNAKERLSQSALLAEIRLVSYKVAMFAEMGLTVHRCGSGKVG